MIPNIIHFIYFSRGRQFHLINYLAIKSASITNKPDKIYFYCDSEPVGEWWEAAKPLVEIVHYEPPRSCFGLEIKHPAHQADIARLQILLEKGGIYLDTDILCRKSFAPLLEFPMVMGEETVVGKTVGLCSGVILAEKNDLFLQRWLEGFDPQRSLWRGFRSSGFDLYYAEMTTRYSKFLSTIYPEEINVLDYKKFFYPTYTQEDLRQFFETNELMDLDECFCHHLWANSAWSKYLEKITVEDIQNKETNFCKIASQFLD